MEIKKNNSKWIVLLSILFVTNLNSQESLTAESYWKVSLSGLLYQPLIIKSQGIELLQSYYTPSGEIGLSYNWKLKNNWGMETGINYSYIPYIFHFNFYSKILNSTYKRKINHKLIEPNYSSARLANHLSIFKDYKLNKSYSLRTQFSLNINFYKLHIDDYYVTIDGDRNFIMEFAEIQPISMAFSHQLKIGLVKQTTSNRQFMINILACYAPRTLAVGSFEFYNIDYDSKGVVKFKASYIGLELGYTFGKIKK